MAAVITFFVFLVVLSYVSDFPQSIIVILSLISAIVIFIILQSREYLLEKPEVITGIGTLVLAIATLLLVFVNLHAQDKPWLSFELHKEESEGNPPKFSLYIMNFGKGIALDIDFRPYRFIDNSKWGICNRTNPRAGPEICCPIESLFPTEKRFVVEITRKSQEDVNSQPMVFIENIKYKDVNGFRKKQKEQIVSKIRDQFN
jgi:hypothetical protein